jgi:hypothetical protein
MEYGYVLRHKRESGKRKYGVIREADRPFTPNIVLKIITTSIHQNHDPAICYSTIELHSAGGRRGGRGLLPL